MGRRRRRSERRSRGSTRAHRRSARGDGRRQLHPHRVRGPSRLFAWAPRAGRAARQDRARSPARRRAWGAATEELAAPRRAGRPRRPQRGAPGSASATSSSPPRRGPVPDRRGGHGVARVRRRGGRARSSPPSRGWTSWWTTPVRSSRSGRSVRTASRRRSRRWSSGRSRWSRVCCRCCGDAGSRVIAVTSGGSTPRRSTSTTCRTRRAVRRHACLCARQARPDGADARVGAAAAPDRRPLQRDAPGLGGHARAGRVPAGVLRVMRPMLRTPAEGVDTIVWLAAGGGLDAPGGSLSGSPADGRSIGSR